MIISGASFVGASRFRACSLLLGVNVKVLYDDVRLGCGSKERVFVVCRTVL